MPHRPNRAGPMNWYAWIKKYVWDDEKTPYFVPVARLSRRQAEYELFVFSVLLAVLFMVVGLAAILGQAFLGKSAGVALYAFAVFCAASVLAGTRHYYAALFCSTAPPAVLLFFLLNGFPPGLHQIDEFLLIAVALLVLRYSFRVVAIARAYPKLPGGAPDP